jgi:hypothetical protein
VPDPLTHLCVALLPKGLLGGRHTFPFALGAVLPDLASRLPSMVLDIVDRQLVPVPNAILYPWGSLHTPIPLVFLCTALALLFPEADRRAVLGWIAGGIALHLALDVMQFHHGEGYQLLFPLTLMKFEIGITGSESTVVWAPWLALATAGVWGIRAGMASRSPA